MLYVFKSKLSADLIMLEPNGRRLLEIIGKETTPQGIITAAQMPTAVQALQAAIGREDDQGRSGGPSDEIDALGAPTGVSLRQRLFPMIEMMRRCERAGKDITWGV